MHTATADGQNIQSRPAKKGCNLGWRHIVTVLCFFGFFFLYALKVNLSVAIVAMVNHTAIHEVEGTTGGNAHDNLDGKVVAEVCTREQKADEAKVPPKKRTTTISSVNGALLILLRFGKFCPNCQREKIQITGSI
ncbi:hypothetical protein Tsp_09631 [Trichinella spiralis]|uniref:hypothetical protein n=1 Tax=Trichinella spiralis TaxID=6334 RepID=UPI0001EFF043|nr:hypothetical protein Tsp_09631 [Trichinella spiralis]